jgi:hypothetical protein
MGATTEIARGLCSGAALAFGRILFAADIGFVHFDGSTDTAKPLLPSCGRFSKSKRVWYSQSLAQQPEQRDRSFDRHSLEIART